MSPDELPESGTYSPAQAARALKVSRETVHRWINTGKLDHVMEAGKSGRLVRRVPIGAIREHIAAGIRETLPRGAVPPLTTQRAGALRPALEDVLALRAQLMIAAESAAATKARLVDAQTVARDAVERLEETRLRWWQRGKIRERDAEARAALRHIASLPEVEAPAETLPREADPDLDTAGEVSMPGVAGGRQDPSTGPTIPPDPGDAKPAQ